MHLGIFAKNRIRPSQLRGVRRTGPLRQQRARVALARPGRGQARVRSPSRLIRNLRRPRLIPSRTSIESVAIAHRFVVHYAHVVLHYYLQSYIVLGDYNESRSRQEQTRTNTGHTCLYS